MIIFLRSLFLIWLSRSGPTEVTEENYAIAETQIILEDYVERIKEDVDASESGTGILIHLTEPMDIDDRTVVRPNFDTLYSFAVLDLKTPATIILPESDSRFQMASIITEDHFNELNLYGPSETILTEDELNTRYAFLIVRTQANTQDQDDMKEAIELMNEIKLEQDDKGELKFEDEWDMEELLDMRESYMQIVYDSDGVDIFGLFGPKGTISDEARNIGVAYGWGGLSPDAAIYIPYASDGVEAQTLTLKDVPVDGFWSITIYDEDGFAKKGTSYNINSAFAQSEENGDYVIHFNGDKDASNYLDIYEGWNMVLRLYKPTEEFDNWEVPELKKTK